MLSLKITCFCPFSAQSVWLNRIHVITSIISVAEKAAKMLGVGPALVHSATRFIKTLTTWQFPLSHQVSVNQARAMLRTTKHNTNGYTHNRMRTAPMPSVWERISASIAQNYTQKLLIHIHDAGYLSGIEMCRNLWGHIIQHTVHLNSTNIHLHTHTTLTKMYQDILWNAILIYMEHCSIYKSLHVYMHIFCNYQWK